MKREFTLLLVLTIFCIPLFGQSERVKLPGMHKAGTITRDANGIAHVFALNEHDLLFLQGWVHADDRFFQMDFNRRLASGTLAEMVGQTALASDVQLRTLGLRRSALASWEMMNPETRDAVTGYAAGVNAWLAQNELPLEYGGLELTEVPEWTPVDSLVIAKLIAFGLAFDTQDPQRTIDLLTWQGVGQAAGFDGTAMAVEDLFRIEPFGKATTVPDATGASASKTAAKLTNDYMKQLHEAAREIDPSAVELAKGVVSTFESNPYLEEALDADFFYGSNEWAIAGEHTSTGEPMIANDPHLALDIPSTFYPMALQAGSINAIGMGFPGTPYVILGHTPDLAWGATNNPLDETDYYIEEIVIDPAAPAGLATRHGDVVEWLFPILQTWRTNVIGDGVNDNLQEVPPGGPIPQASLIVPRRNAPIIALDLEAGTAISVQHTGFNATQEVEAFRLWNRSSTIEEFRDALKWFDFGSQNWTVTDTSGDIAYFTSGELPLREDLEAGTVVGLPPYFLRNGPEGNDWIRDLDPAPAQATPNAILPFEEMPQVVNPSEGFFVNANNDPAGTTLDNNPLNQLRPNGGIYYLNSGYDAFRGTRITDMIREKIDAGETISFEDMQAMQADTVMIDAQFFVPWILQAFENGQSGTAHPALAQIASQPAIQAAVARLSAWNFSTPTGIPAGFDASDENGQLSAPSEAEVANSVAATIYSLWRGRLIANTVDAVIDFFDAATGMDLPRPGSQPTLNSLHNHLENWEQRQGVGASGVPFFSVPGIDDPDAARDVILLGSVGEALQLITSEEFAPAFGQSLDMTTWNWGKLHRVVFDHPLGGILSIPPAGGGFPPPLEGLPGIPVDGGLGTVDASNHSARADGLNDFMFGSGPVRRFVAEGHPDGIVAETSLPGGTSGTLGNPFYANLLPMWLTNEAFPSVLQAMPRIPWVR
ncbi:MAG: penicillin acylase family protein [Thermoanaerobaculia bacterium]|nr:penicillin acylase family protein [Thermoanaerobaculia bacterium]